MNKTTWQEDCLAVLFFHEANVAAHDLGKKQKGRPKKYTTKVGWSIKDTAEELGTSIGAVHLDLRLGYAIRLGKYVDIPNKRIAISLLKEDEKNR